MDVKQRVLGWVADLPDFRDKLFQDLMREVGQIRFPVRGWLWWKHTVYPEIVDLRSQPIALGVVPPVYDQGSVGSCVANATCALLAYVESREKLNETAPSLSRLFAYANARSNVAVDHGSTFRNTFKGITKFGICTENEWPYDVAEALVKPSAAAYQAAQVRKKISYSTLITLDDMLACIASGYPFVYGMSIYDSFENWSADTSYKGTPVIPMPKKTDAYVGGHGLCIVGYDLGAKLFLVRNSWGTGWANQGYAWIPFDYLTNPFLADSFWTCRYIADP